MLKVGNVVENIKPVSRFYEEIGIITKVDPVQATYWVKWDSSKTSHEYKPNSLNFVEEGTEGFDEVKKVEKPKTTLEKNALKEAKEDRIKEITEKKAEDYKSAFSEWYDLEKSARDYREKADELRDKLGITDTEMKEVF